MKTRFLLVTAAALALSAPLFSEIALLPGVAHAEERAATLGDASKAFEEGRLEECVSICDGIPAEGDEHRRALFLRAESLLRLGRAAEAQAGFDAVLASNAKSVPALIGRGRALHAQGNAEEAEAALRGAVKLDKKSAYAHRALGEFLITRSQFSDARTTLAKAWKLDSSDPLTAIALVDVQLGYKDAKGAVKVSRQMIKARPQHPVGHFLLGRALEHDGEWKDAIVAYEKALECDDAYIDAHKNLAIVCQTQNSMYRDKALLDKSMSHYERYFELGGEQAELRQIYEQMVGFLAWQKENADK